MIESPALIVVEAARPVAEDIPGPCSHVAVLLVPTFESEALQGDPVAAHT